MDESYEFRIAERKIGGLFQSSEGEILGGTTRKIVLKRDDPRIMIIAQKDREYKKIDRAFFTSFEIIRKYSKDEINTSQLLHLKIKHVFEPAGEECGTVYDESLACPHCGANARLVSRLRLDYRRFPKSKDIAKTIAGEVVVSQRFKDIFEKHNLQGVQFIPVMGKKEHFNTGILWHAPNILSHPLDIDKRTVTGNDPFDFDSLNCYRCPDGHVIGLQIVSEVHVKFAESIIHDDIFITKQLVGIRRGLLRPEPVWIISQRLYNILEREKIKGYSVERVHLESI